MLEILRAITAGKGKMEDIDLLSELGEAIKIGSICGLGQTAPNPVLTTIRYFREEYESHIYEKQCPALVCRELISYHILPDKCKACIICLRECPAGAISGGKRQVHVIDQPQGAGPLGPTLALEHEKESLGRLTNAELEQDLDCVGPNAIVR